MRGTHVLLLYSVINYATIQYTWWFFNIIPSGWMEQSRYLAWMENRCPLQSGRKVIFLTNIDKSSPNGGEGGFIFQLYNYLFIYFYLPLTCHSVSYQHVHRPASLDSGCALISNHYLQKARCHACLLGLPEIASR